MTERSGALQEDPLYMSYAEIVAKSCGEEEEEGGEEEENECVLDSLKCPFQILNFS